MRTKIVFLLLVALLSFSCKEFLTVTPQGTVIPKTDDEFEALLNGTLFDIERGYEEYVIGNYETLITFESMSDNLDANVTVGNLLLYAGDRINVFQEGHYNGLYAKIRDCNILLDNLKGRDSEKARRICAAAYSIKGICYYNLLRIYCEPYDKTRENLLPGMPIIDKFDVETYQVPERGTIKATYDYAASLLNSAITFGMTDNNYLFNADAAKAYLAKLHFWAGEWEKAVPLCEELLASYPVTERGAYQNMVQSYLDRLGEVIVRERTVADEDIKYFYDQTFRSSLASRPVSGSLVKLFGSEPEKDIRWSVMCNNKRVNQKAVTARVRASEICLMLAECYAHLGGDENNGKALALLNGLRKKRIEDAVDLTMATLPAPDPATTIKVDAEGQALTPLMSAIFDERRKELYMEGDRWFELKRNGRPEWWVIVQTGSTLPVKYTTSEYLYTMPVSVRDVVKSGGKMAQNPGYEY